MPLAEFVPLSAGCEDRHRLVGRYGSVELYIYDPYSLALSKIARGLESEVSPGRVTAPASVILSPADIGGVLAHGSIVAREYGIPAVMGTTVATT